ncbi:MAG: hypothetical protein GX442_22570 [Candidatus Riflebacteria bacterium]|nr:hypothetical protein [Candidatus Riflebacteria bacterium]
MGAGQWLLAGLLFLLFGFLVFWNLGGYHPWGDEGETGVYARNILRCGFPKAFDGRNVFEYRGGVQANPEYLNVHSPWLQYYVGALGLACCGDDAWGLRVPFALFALAAHLLFFGYCLKVFPDSRTALTALALFSLNTQLILFCRQARYYPLVLFLSVFFLRCIPSDDGRIRHHGLLWLSLILLFFAHPLAGFCLAASVMLYQGFRRGLPFLREVWKPALMALLPIFLFLAWQKAEGAPPSPFIMTNLAPPKALWVFLVFIKDLHWSGVIPLGLVAGFFGLWATSRSPDDRPLFHIGFQAFATGAGFLLLLAWLSIQPSEFLSADLRYALPAFPLFLVFQAAFFAILSRRFPRTAVFFLGVALFTGFFSGKLAPSPLFSFLAENLHPFPNSTRVAVEYLQ